MKNFRCIIEWVSADFERDGLLKYASSVEEGEIMVIYSIGCGEVYGILRSRPKHMLVSIPLAEFQMCFEAVKDGGEK